MSMVDAEKRVAGPGCHREIMGSRATPAMIGRSLSQLLQTGR
jgi:hypothetical protein